MGNSSKEKITTPSGWPGERASFSNTGESTVFLFPKPTGKGAICTNFPVLPRFPGALGSLLCLDWESARQGQTSRGSRMLAELTGDITQGEVGWRAEFTFLLCPHSLCTYTWSLLTPPDQRQFKGHPRPLVQTSEDCHYITSPPQRSSWTPFLTCSTRMDSSFLIKKMPFSFARLLPASSSPTPHTPPTQSHFLVVPHLAALSVVLKQKHVSCHK